MPGGACTSDKQCAQSMQLCDMTRLVCVDCLDVALADVSDPWTTPRTPGHAD